MVWSIAVSSQLRYNLHIKVSSIRKSVSQVYAHETTFHFNMNHSFPDEHSGPSLHGATQLLIQVAAPRPAEKTLTTALVPNPAAPAL